MMNATLRTGQSSKDVSRPPSALPPGWGKPKNMSPENRAKLALAAKNASAAIARQEAQRAKNAKEAAQQALIGKILTETPVEKKARLEEMQRRIATEEEARITRYGPGYVAPSVNLNSNSNNEGPTRGHFAVPLGTKTGPVRTRRVNRRSVLRKPNAASKKRSIVWSNSKGSPLASLPNEPSLAAPPPRTRDEMLRLYAHQPRTGRWPHNDENAREYRFYPGREDSNYHNKKPYPTTFEQAQQRRYRQALIERPTLLPADD